jgi:hypothetical protein
VSDTVSPLRLRQYLPRRGGGLPPFPGANGREIAVQHRRIAFRVWSAKSGRFKVRFGQNL